jgi:orotidine-5'-phosphate decarboxylase
VTSVLDKLDTRGAISQLCVGLDPEIDKLPLHFEKTVDSLLEFNLGIIDATKHLAMAYKPNLAFYEAHGVRGWTILKQTLAAIPQDIPVILDAKRGDIGNTARLYAQSLFEELGGDAITLHPYMGVESIEPYLTYSGKMVFVLAATSNPGSAQLQDVLLHNGKPYLSKVIDMSLGLSTPQQIGFVAGATDLTRLKLVRDLAPESWLLVPGVGAQGGTMPETLAVAGPKAIINVGRQIIYASNQKDFAEAAYNMAFSLKGR